MPDPLSAIHCEPATFSDGADGTVSAVVGSPLGFQPGTHTAIILAHGAGSDMNNPLMVGIHAGLARLGYLTVRFNFPYKEKGGRLPNPAPVLERCYRAVVSAMRDSPQPPRHLIIGGKSLGGRIASHLGAAGAAIDGLVFLGYPLHPAGRPDQLRTAHLPRIRTPMLFITGTRDRLCPLDLLRQTLAGLTAPSTLHVIPGGDHSLAVPRRSGRSPADVQTDVIATIDSWIRGVAG